MSQAEPQQVPPSPNGQAQAEGSGQAKFVQGTGNIPTVQRTRGSPNRQGQMGRVGMGLQKEAVVG